MPSNIGKIAAGLYRIVVMILRSTGYYHFRNESYVSLVLESVGVEGRPEKILLDVGCGPGGITSILADTFDVVGLDVNRHLLLNFVKATVPRVQAHAEFLPFKKGSVDILVAISLVEHLTRQRRFFAGVAQVLKDDGLALLQVPEMRFLIEPHTKWPLLFAWRESLQSRVLTATGYRDVDLSTSLEKVVDLAREHGLEAGRIYPIWHFRLARFLRIPMGYFIALRKSLD